MSETKTAYEKYFKINITAKKALLSFGGAFLVSVILMLGLWHLVPDSSPFSSRHMADHPFRWDFSHLVYPFVFGGISGGLFVLFIGLGVSRCSCCECGNPLPKIRWPKTKEEMLWGGWTCVKCGTSVDRFGKKRA